MTSLPHLLKFLQGLPKITGAFSADNHEYHFEEFSPNKKHINQFGLKSAVIDELDCYFFPEWSKYDGPKPDLEIRGVGPGLEAVVDVFEKYMPLFENDSSDLLEKYAMELMDVAKAWYEENRAKVRQKQFKHK